VFKVERGHDLASGIEDDGMMLLLGPVDAGEVSEGRFRGSHRDFLVRGFGARLRSPGLGFSPSGVDLIQDPRGM
jgi:hypothetical protein